ncbi:hypothetical protein [Metabacillus idriensis]|uniref:hypothetical protein n=1 Tax=Metabacillus idriensis TaxID=324768 RepID=UPI00174B322C|nr:hypothetical protein [Metabacillus idriensis]
MLTIIMLMDELCKSFGKKGVLKIRIQNQIVIEWIIAKYYEDFSFEKRLENAIKMQMELHPLKEGEALEIHQVVFVGEFNNEKVYLIILNIVPEKVTD